MNICIDGFGAESLKGTGHHIYTRNLIDGLLESYPQPHYSLIWQDSEIDEEWRKKRIAFESLKINRVSNDLKTLEQYLAEKKISLFHSPNNGFSIPGSKVCKYVITVHDLIAKTHAELVDEDYKRKFDKVFDNALHRADKIIAVSEFIKGELLREFHMDAKKIQVAYPWFAKKDALDTSASQELLENKYGINYDYILSIGSIHPRKNLLTLIRAFKESELYKEGFKLILAGNKDGKRQNYYLQLKAFVEKIEMTGSVMFLGHIDYEDVQPLYKKARCVVNLSDYEGFPQVCLEAMTIGTPVVCGRSSSFEEVVGKAGHYVDTKNLHEIKRILRQVTLYESQDKIEEGLRQSERFDKNESLKKIVSVYENVVY